MGSDILEKGYYAVSDPKKYYDVVGNGIRDQDRIPDGIVYVQIVESTVKTDPSWNTHVSFIREIFDEKELVKRPRFVNRRTLQKLELDGVLEKESY